MQGRTTERAEKNLLTAVPSVTSPLRYLHPLRWARPFPDVRAGTGSRRGWFASWSAASPDDPRPHRHHPLAAFHTTMRGYSPHPSGALLRHRERVLLAALRNAGVDLRDH